MGDTRTSSPGTTAGAGVGARGVQTAIAVFLAMFMAFIDGTVVNLALPSIQSGLQTDFASLQWTVNGYILSLAALLLLGGVLGDRFGLKRLFLLGVTVFTLGSVGCALAPGIGLLIGSRVVQGIGAAMFMPGTLAILTRTFSEPAQRARIIGLWSAVAGLSMAVGPVLGGLLIDLLGWRSIFFINVPLSVVVLLLGFRAITEYTGGERGRLDLAGQVLAVGWLVSLTYGLISSSALGLGSPVVLGLLGLAVLLFVAFLVVQLRSANPMLPMSLFRSRAFATCTGLVLMVGFGLIGTFFFLSLFLQNVQHNSPLAAGVRLLPAVLAVTVVAPFAGRTAGKHGSRYLVAAGMTTVGAALLGFGLFVDADTSYGAWWPVLALLGVGVGLTQSPTMAAMMGSVPPQRAGLASATGNTSQQVGGVLSIALLSTIVSARFASFVAEPAGRLGVEPGAQQEQLVRSATTARSVPEIPGVDPVALQNLARDGFVHGLHTAMYVAAAVYLCGALAAALFLGSGRSSAAGQ